MGYRWVYHHTPLHYLPQIAKLGVLLSKEGLLSEGYGMSHFRTTSRRQDFARGFGNYVHLTLSPFPRILRAKLKRGFPHLTIAIPSETFGPEEFALCRYNIAKTRLLRRGSKLGAPEAPYNGRYYGDIQVPIAVTADDKAALLAAYGTSSMIEVLVADRLYLPTGTHFLAYSIEDQRVATEVFTCAEQDWSLEVQGTAEYKRVEAHASAVQGYIRAVLNGTLSPPELEFDNL